MSHCPKNKTSTRVASPGTLHKLGDKDAKKGEHERFLLRNGKNLNRHVCHKYKCEVYRPFLSTGVNPEKRSRIVVLCRVFDLEFNRIHLA